MTNIEIIESVRAAACGQVPRQDISALLYRHGCHSILLRFADPRLKQQLIVEKALNTVAVKERFKACKCLFEQNDIQYAVIKGAILSYALYGDPFIRSSGDIDILIHRRDTDKTKALLKETGFVQGRATEHGIVPFSRREILFQSSMSHQTAPYVKKTGNRLCPYVNLDVNTDIMWGESEEKSDMDIVLNFTEKFELLGTHFYKFSPAMEFISLCLHHYKDMNSLYLLSKGSLRLGLFCDIYDYVKNVCPNINEIKDICKALNVGKYIYVCLAHTHEIFNDDVILEYMTALDEYMSPQLLNSFGLCDKERKAWSIGLLDRILHHNLSEYLDQALSNEEKEKIKLNQELM